MFFFPFFAVPQLEITDERGVQVKDKFYYVGSTIELKCYITKVPQPSQFIVWRHESTSLNYDTSRGGIRYEPLCYYTYCS